MNPLIKAAYAQRSRKGINQRVKGEPGADSTTLRYNCVSNGYFTDGSGLTEGARRFIPGNPDGMVANAGVSVTSYYSTGLFKPGTTVKWVPYVGYQTSGRVMVAFTDNPEIMHLWPNWTQAQRQSWIRSASSVQNMPIYEERTIVVPHRPRRKRFDVNPVATLTDVDVLDRSCQVGMFVAIIAAPASTLVGQFEFHDVVAVEGLSTANI